MSATPDNLIYMRRGYEPHPKADKSDAFWPHLRDTVVARGFSLCYDHFSARNVQCGVAHITSSNPSCVLFWNGASRLYGLRMGLQFTYGWQGRFCFNLSAVRFAGDHMQQGSFFQKQFSAGPGVDLGKQIISLMAKGIRLSDELSALPALPEIEWRRTFPLPRRN